jgi:DNA polymerase III gamma/tau subunit
VAATLAAPFAIGVAEYSEDPHPSSPSLDQPDLAADATVEPTPSDKPNVMNYQTSEYARRADAPAPTVTVTVTATPSASPSDDSRAPDAQESAQNEKYKQKGLVGRHRKPEANPAAADEAAAKKKHKPHHHHHPKPHDDDKRQGSVSTLVGNILEPVQGILG